MKIDKDKCVGCANCVPVCPVGAIYIADDKLSEINPETCVECHNCFRSLSPEHLPPGVTRLIRKILKAISLRFQPAPDVCPTDAIVHYFRDVQTVTSTLAAEGVTFESGNPVTQLMSDVQTGFIREDLLDEKVLSCIVEVTVPLDETVRHLDLVKRISRSVETVISIGVSTVCDEDGGDPLREILLNQGFELGWGKMNLGFGRVSNQAVGYSEDAR
ncbi:MAG: 4Fe-4S binding protein [Desulfofustis sp.]